MYAQIPVHKQGILLPNIMKRKESYLGQEVLDDLAIVWETEAK